MKDKFYYTNEIANAIQRRQLFYTIQDAIPTTLIKLPTPQTCGTMTQQRSYAMDKAIRILNSLTL